MSGNKENLSNLGFVFIGLYGLSVTIFAVYFNWQYAQQHGFMDWLLLGDIISTLKAIVWPFYIFG